MSARIRALLAVGIGLFVITAIAGVAAATAPIHQTAAAAAAPYSTIEGSGSTWSELMVRKWIADVDRNGMKVVYSGGGSTKGRKDFAQASVDYAISEIPYQGVDEDGNADRSSRPYVYLPIVAGGTAFTYQLKVGNELVRNLRLSGETIAKIFTNQITTWSDPQIAKDNNGRKLPDIPITPVVRADGSGTTAQFTAWLDKQYPGIWRPYFGKSGLTSYYPVKSGSRMTRQAGSDQVMNIVKGFSGNGHIGYVEYSYPKDAGFPVVKLLNKAGYFVEPTQYNVAVGLTKARINPGDLTQILDGVYANAAPQAYPLSSYSYLIMPTAPDDTRMDTSKRQTLADFLYHSLCAGQRDAGPYGYSPLPLNLVQAGFDQVKKLKQADSGVNLTSRDVRSCNNPTFDGKNPNKNVLAEIAPMPAACDKVGQGPCTDATGQGGREPGGGGGGGGAGAGGSGAPDASGGGGDAAGGDGAAVDDEPVVDPETGEVASTDAVASGGSTVVANPTLLSSRPGDIRPFAWLAVVLAFGLVLVPGLVVSTLRRRRAALVTR